MQASWRRRVGFRRRGWLAAAFALLAMALAVVQAKPKGANVHQPNAACGDCHTADRATLEADPVAARTLLVPDLDARCTACHDDEGPSHRTGIPPRQPVPDTLPLSGGGLITCATCHFVHGDHHPFADFVRLDNSRGGLCLTCHALAELQ
jgi:hypothetical protein